MQKFVTIILFAAMLLIIDAADSDDGKVKDPLAEECRAKLNTCLDRAEDRTPGVQRKEWIFLEVVWRVAFDIDSCCDEYKLCMYRIGRN